MHVMVPLMMASWALSYLLMRSNEIICLSACLPVTYVHAPDTQQCWALIRECSIHGHKEEMVLYPGRCMHTGL